MSVENNYTDEISLKELSKKIIRISNKKKKTFTLLFIGIMLLSAAYFIKIIIKPSYKSEVILKSKFLRKDAFNNILETLNTSLKDGEGEMDDKLRAKFLESSVIRIETTEIKADITSPEKDDRTKYYRLTMLHSDKPKKTIKENFPIILQEIKENAAIDNDISINKKKTEEAITELDSLLQTALPAGNSFKNRMDAGTSMLVMNDLYKSLNELLARKSGLKTELQYYQTENLVYQASPIVLSKRISFPLIIFAVGLLVWIFICLIWIGGIIVFGDED
jgi:hypothetical protein